jgi:hypothetical protein
MCNRDDDDDKDFVTSTDAGVEENALLDTIASLCVVDTIKRSIIFE